jgi:peptide/nickel transport system substrate-binding protein
MRRVVPAVLAVAAVVALASGDAVGSGAKGGGTFRVVTWVESLQSIDPAFIGGVLGPGSYLAAVCETPLAYAPGRTPPGRGVVPQGAVGYPKLSRDRKTYTFTIRSGLRFASGAPLTARNYVYGINRGFNPKLHPDDADAVASSPFGEIVGARAVLEGKATDVVGVRARGRKLIITLERPDSTFLTFIAGGSAIVCPVPLGLPVDPEGIAAPFSGGGPYYVSKWIPGEELDLARNGFYGGTRPQHVARFVVTPAGSDDATLRGIDAGTIDWADRLPSTVPDLAKRYDVNKAQFFVHPVPAEHYLALNTSRPLFRNNAVLRRAVNFAIDRTAILREYGPYAGRAADQYVPSAVPGFRDAHIYPLNGPDLRKARTLARGHTRSGKAIYYARDDPRNQAVAQIVQENLKKIGLDVEIQTFPSPVALDKMGTRGEPFDIGIFGLTCDPDPECFLRTLDGRTITASNNFDFSYFDAPWYNRRFAKVSALPLGRARERAFFRLDMQVASREAPLVALVERTSAWLFSRRAGCIAYAGAFVDVASLCLK